jgi:hypothetical protein
MAEKQTPTDLGRKWYAKLLKRELIRSGNESAVHYLDERMRIEVVDASPDADAEWSFTGAVYSIVSDYNVTLNAVTGEQMGWYLDAASRDGTTDTSKQVMLEIATTAAHLPEDAELDSAEYEEDAPTPIFRARWSHRLNGVPIEADYIEVLANGALQQPFAVSRLWHTPAIGAAAAER